MRLCDAFEQTRCRVARFERKIHNFAASTRESSVLMHGRCVNLCGPATNKNVGNKTLEKIRQRYVVKLDYVIDCSKRGENFGSFGGGSEWAQCDAAFWRIGGAGSSIRDSSESRVAFHSDYEYCAKGARLIEKTDVTRVEQVKTTPCAHHSLAVAFPLPPAENQLSLRNNLSQSTAPRSAPAGTAEHSILPRASREPRTAR